MANAAHSSDPRNSAAWFALEPVFRAFEEAWRRGERPAIDDSLPEGDCRGPALEELARIELECRLRAGEAARAEDYLARYPELARDARAAVELVLVEYRQRRQAGAGSKVDEYLRRFPRLAAALRARLRPPSLAAARPAPMGTQGRPSGAGKQTAGPGPGGAGADALPSIPGYEILGRLGRGGMGVVYKARHLALNRLVALKMILAGSHAEPEQLRFRREAEAAARLQHPNVVQIYEVGERDGLPFFALELVEGGSLDGKLRGVPRPARLAAKLVEVLARAMQAAHERGIVHRDLKPANVLLGADGRPKVTDFGLAKQLDGQTAHTETGAVLGTPQYMAPEQAWGRGHEVGPAADIYALGVILYEALTGRPPFLGEHVLQTLHQVCSQDPVPPRHLQPTVPHDLEKVCLKCLQKEPRKRYGSAGDLAGDLRRFLNGEPVRARPVRWPERALKWAKRRPAVAGLLAAVVAVVALGAAGVLWKYREAEYQRGVAEEKRLLAEQMTEAAQGAEGKAKEAAAAEEKARHLAEEEKSETARQRDRVEGLAYASQMALAYRDWQDGEAVHARILLQGCNPSLRGWEYRFLRHLVDVHGQWTPDPPRGVKPNGRWAVLSPDGRRAASDVSGTGDGDEVVVVWDVTGDTPGRVLLTLKWGKRLFYGVPHLAFSSDGRLLAAGTFDKTVEVWDVAAGRRTLTVAGLKRPAYALTFSPDGTHLAASDSVETRTWNLPSGREESCLALPAFGLSFSPDGKRLAAVTRPKGKGPAVAVWDVASGQKVWDLFPPETDLKLYGSKEAVGGWASVAFRPDGKELAAACLDSATGTDGVVRVWNAVTGQELRTFAAAPDFVTALAYSLDGKRLGGTRGTAVKVWDATTGREELTLRGHNTGGTMSVAFTPDGQRLVSAAPHGEIKVWDAVTGQRPRSLGDTWASYVAFSRDGGRILTGEDGQVRLWDAATGKELPLAEARCRGVAAGAYGRLLAAFSPDGRSIATGEEGGPVRVWAAADGKEICTPRGQEKHAGRPPRSCVCFSPDGKRLAAGCGGEVTVWDMPDGKEVFSLQGHASGVWSLAFSPDGSRLASGSGNGMVRVWDMSSGQERLSLKDRTGSHVSALAFSPDGRRLAGGSGSDKVAVWDAAGGTELLLLKGYPGMLFSVAFSSDGHRLVSSSPRGIVQFWDAESGQETFALKAETPFRSYASVAPWFAFSPSGNCLATAGNEGVKLWDAVPGEPQQGAEVGP